MENKCGDRIKERLQTLDMTQADLSRKTGISTATISQYVSGKYFPAQDRLETIANALLTTPAYLMGWSEKVKDYNPLKDAKWDKVEELYNLPTGSLELLHLYNQLDPTSQKQVYDYAKFLLSQKG